MVSTVHAIFLRHPTQRSAAVVLRKQILGSRVLLPYSPPSVSTISAVGMVTLFSSSTDSRVHMPLRN